MHDIGHLRHFLAVMDHGSLSEAAQHAFVSQPALTKSIQRFEASLGHALFDRSARLEPTALALRIAPLCRKVVLGFDDIGGEAELFMNSALGDLRIGAGPFFAETLVAPAIRKLLQNRVNAHVDLEVIAYDALPEKLRARELDMFVGDISELRHDPDLVIVPMPSFPLIWVCRKGHPLCERKQLLARDMYAYPFVLPRPTQWGIDWLDRNVPPKLRGQKKGRDFVAMFSNNLGSLREVVLNTDSITAMSVSMLEPEWRKERFHRLPVKSPPPYSDAGIVMLKDRSMAPIATLMLEILQKDIVNM